jgi:hypothetical protein
MLGPMGQAQVVHDESGWTISFAQALVSQLRVDHALTLLLDDDSIIRIESPFELISAGGATRLPLGECYEVAPALPLLHQTVRRARIGPSGTLRLEFANDWRIDVPVNPNYENWQLNAGSLGTWVGLPGGDVSAIPPT